MSKKRRSGASRKARRGNRRSPRHPSMSVVFTDCPGCALCDLLAGSGSELVTIHPWDDRTDENHPLYSEEPGASHAGPSFDQTPSRTWSDLHDNGT